MDLLDLQTILILNTIVAGFFAGQCIVFGSNAKTRLVGAAALIVFMLTGGYMLTN